MKKTSTQSILPPSKAQLQAYVSIIERRTNKIFNESDINTISKKYTMASLGEAIRLLRLEEYNPSPYRKVVGLIQIELFNDGTIKTTSFERVNELRNTSTPAYKLFKELLTKMLVFVNGPRKIVKEYR